MFLCSDAANRVRAEDPGHDQRKSQQDRKDKDDRDGPGGKTHKHTLIAKPVNPFDTLSQPLPLTF